MCIRDRKRSDRWHDVNNARLLFVKSFIQLLCIGDDPCCSFPLTLSTMAIAIFFATMISSDPYLPFFVEIFFTILNCLPYFAYLFIHFINRIIHLLAIAVSVSHLISVFEVNPGKVRRNSFDISSSCISYCFCLLYTSDAADERSSVDLGGRR